MLIEKIATKLHIKSKTGQLMLGACLTGVSAFVVIFALSSAFLDESKTTILGASVLCSAIVAILYFIKGLMRQ